MVLNKGRGRAKGSRKLRPYLDQYKLLTVKENLVNPNSLAYSLFKIFNHQNL